MKYLERCEKDEHNKLYIQYMKEVQIVNIKLKKFICKKIIDIYPQILFCIFT
jgi:hypothetical protein